MPLVQRAAAIARAFHIDPVAVLSGSWFEWRVRNAALEVYIEAQGTPKT